MAWSTRRFSLRTLTTLTVVTMCSLLASPGYADSEDKTLRNPFDGPVGGERLGIEGRAVYDSEVAAPPSVPVKSYVVADLDTGKVLAAKNAHVKRRPASTLKTLTAVTLLPRLNPRAIYPATQADANVEGSKVGIEKGRKYTIDQLFYGLFLPSGNDAANALANAGGGLPATLKLMNREAKRLGAYDTNAVNPSGLDDPGQSSSAYDLALIGRAGMAMDSFARYANTRSFKFPGRGGKTFAIQNLNKLLANYDGAYGVKNGYTTQARYTLIGAAERGERRLIVVVMGSEAPYWEKAAALLDWGFANGAEAEPVGRLVTSADVERAAEKKWPTKKTSSTTAPDEPDSAESLSAAPPAGGGGTAAPAQASSALLSPQSLWLVGAGLVFVVLASLRVRAHVRSRRRPARAAR